MEASVLAIRGIFSWPEAEKVNAQLFRATVHAFVAHILEKHRDPDDINEALHKIGRNMGKMLFVTYLDQLSTIARDVKELSGMNNMGFKFFFGKTFDEIILEESDTNITIKLRIEDCPICRDIVLPRRDVFFCEPMAGVFEWIGEQLADYMGVKSIRCRETRCRARGDKFCEFSFFIEKL